MSNERDKLDLKAIEVRQEREAKESTKVNRSDAERNADKEDVARHNKRSK